MKIDKYDLWVIISIIVSAMLLSLAMAIESNSVFVTFVVCVLFTTFCFHLVTYSIKLFNVYREEKELNMLINGIVNCPDRVAPPKFRKGDWITGIPGHIDDERFLKVEDIITTDSRGTCYFIPDILSVVETFSGVIPAFIIDKWYRLASPEELQQNGITINSNE